METQGGTACTAVATWLGTPQYPEVSKGQGRRLCPRISHVGKGQVHVQPEEGPGCRQARASQGWRGARGAQQGLPGTEFLSGH